MRYAKVENGDIIRVFPSNPRWTNDSGVELTDVEYIRDHQVHPVIDADGLGTIYFDRPLPYWSIVDNNVIPAYYTLKGSDPINTLGTYYVKNDISLWDIDGMYITPTYTMRTRTDTEIDNIINNSIVSENVNDTTTPRPRGEWLYYGLYVTKTYYNIISDPERDNHLKELYNIERTNISDWVVSGDNIQEVCIFTPKTDISEIKSLLYNRSTRIRYEIEISGMTYNLDGIDVIIDSDRFSQSRVSAKYLYYKTNVIDDTTIITWKTNSGTLRMTISMFKEMATKMFYLIDGLYTTEATLNGIIEASETFNELEYISTTLIDQYSQLSGVVINDNIGE